MRALAVTRTRIESLISRTCDYLRTSAGADRCVKYLRLIGAALNKVWTLALACAIIEPLPRWTSYISRASALTGTAVKDLSRVWTPLGSMRTFTSTGPVIEYLIGVGAVCRPMWALASAEDIVEYLWLRACQDLWALTLANCVIEDLLSRASDRAPRTLAPASPIIEYLSWVGALLGPVWTFTLAANSVEDLRLCACWYGMRAFTAARTGVELLVTWTIDHSWTLALTCPIVEHLWRSTFRSWGGAFALTGDLIESLWSSALWTWCRALTPACIGVESLVAWTIDHSWTLALTGPVIEDLCRSAFWSWAGAFTLTGT